MNTLITFPEWVPSWVPLVLLVPALLYALAFLFMPFSVLGVKTRLEVMEGRLDEIQQEIRHLALRLPVGPREMDFEEVYTPSQRSSRRDAAINDRPPIPPAAQDLRNDRGDRAVSADSRLARRQEPMIVRPERSEPRLDRQR